MKKIYISIILIVTLSLCLLTGCSKDENSNKNAVEETKGTATMTNNKEKNETAKQETKSQTMEDVDFKSAAEKQMALPEKGEEIAIFHIKGFGDIKVKFFKDVAPKAVENFITHAKNGYYNGVIFHRVINEFMIQGGDPTGTGTGGESIWGKGFPEELAYELVPYKGSLCMASAGTGTSSLGSQFFITQANHNDDIEKLMERCELPAGLIEQYKTYAGDIMNLYCRYTVFGQVYEGMDVVDKIAAVKTGTVPMIINGVEYGQQEDKPVEDVVIESIEITTYK